MNTYLTFKWSNLPFYLIYRYKMPKMVLKQESRLNGVKTNIFNLDEVAAALRVNKEGKMINVLIKSCSFDKVLVR